MRRSAVPILLLLIVGGLCAMAVVAAAPGVAAPSTATEFGPVSPTLDSDPTFDTEPTLDTQWMSDTESTVDLYADSDDIRLTTTLDRTPSRVGEITATVSFRIPDRVTELTARLPEEAAVQRTNGFDRDTDTTYDWDGETSRPSVTFRVPADRLSDREGPLAEDGRFLFADTADWSLVRIPQTSVNGRFTGSTQPQLVRDTRIDGPGAAGETMAFLGDHRLRTHRAHGQTFRLVIPDAASLRASPADIFESLAYASDRLRVGDRDEEVFIVAAPTGDVDWAARGIQTGESDIWVQDSERLDVPSNVWVHEYVHTRQDYRAADDFRWFTEGSATYYTALLTLESGQIDFQRFQQFMRQGERSPQASATLSNPSRWDNFADYSKGALVAGELDRQIRETRNREASLDTVFANVNSHSGEVRARDFRRYVVNAGDSTVGDEAHRFTSTSAGPEMWDSEAHASAFGGLAPARFDTRLADSDPISVSGPDREAVLTDPPFALDVGETLRVEMVVENVGETAGDYDLVFRVADSEDIRSGRLDPGETEAQLFTYTFDDPGEYVVTVGDETFTVAVVGADEDDASGGFIGDDEAEPIVDVDTDIETPGFGVVVAVAALALAAYFARGRR